MLVNTCSCIVGWTCARTFFFYFFLLFLFLPQNLRRALVYARKIVSVHEYTIKYYNIVFTRIKSRKRGEDDVYIERVRENEKDPS